MLTVPERVAARPLGGAPDRSNHRVSMADQAGDQKPTADRRSSDLLAELRHFTRGLERWRHPLNRKLLFTPGVHYLAEEAGAHWLIDVIASWLPSSEFAAAARHDSRLLDIQFWKLTVKGDKSATLTAVADSGEPPFIRQAIEFTDFPLAEIDLYCVFGGTHSTLMLPSEY